MGNDTLGNDDTLNCKRPILGRRRVVNGACDNNWKTVNDDNWFCVKFPDEKKAEIRWIDSHIQPDAKVHCFLNGDTLSFSMRRLPPIWPDQDYIVGLLSNKQSYLRESVVGRQWY